MKCNHSCDCCEILCSDAIKKNNESLSNQLEKIKSLEAELEKVKEENRRLKSDLGSAEFCLKLSNAR